MRTLRRAALLVLAIMAGEALLLLCSAAMIYLYLKFTRLVGIQHMLGMDTQTTKNYASVSGYLPIVVAINGFSGLLVTALRHLNCEEPGCWKLGKPHPGHGRYVCRDHHHSVNVIPVLK